MKIISWNVNGIRAVERKEDLGAFIKKHNPDILFIQETKSQEEQIQKIIDAYQEYDQHYHSAEKKGYSGTSIWIKKSLGDYTINRGIPRFKENEGRIISVDIGEWTLFGNYFPNGGKSSEAWEGKLVFYEKFLKHINTLRKKGRKVVWCGDINCAHEEIDIARPKNNDGKIGFHPKERAWITKCIKNNWIDIFRHTFKDKVMYSYWHMISKARSRNVGWRIDYFFVDKEDVKKVKSISYDNDQMGSDHCPVILEIAI
ncbi:MAG: exodeoxyribonuclease III [Candidatus Magasanikbacteria bacterium]|jgi:exodeoxyribonuclease III|nr:exodeoxyribonuclease III [Candidatus Magasanikbacteria bacterium]MBT4221046.1 exodeoxyribonuclease III [Candidatus Magasanikbacteria bacterium]MBT4350610.1 exodeoxyribonuclease III [Candidatus Magasanikbacteria bacterium]MBT4542091.1 exodeoxyribonuclease III [Candidatus Magasanikbacteria bacterium]MBT6253607.1 exodeoxyribonuclease III [Candidatus Magasanikbacteria bacterium]